MTNALNKIRNNIGEVNWSLSFGVAFFTLTLLLIWFSISATQKWLATEENSRITRLIVQGKPQFTAKSEIIDAIKQAQLSSFFDLDVNQVQDLVTALPWVAQVSVRKQWPDTVKVYVTEHQAVAIWNHDLLINEQGGVFHAPVTKYQAHLPKLYGPEGSETEAWQTFVKFDELFQLHQMRLSSLSLSERFSWQLWLDNGIKLHLGRNEKAQRVQRFIDLYPQIKNSSDKEVESIDLRYDTGLAVSWKQSAENKKEEKSKV